MSLKIEHQGFPDNASERFDTILMEHKISYTRDFLLSLSTLDACKKLPSGFNESFLSEFGDGLQSIPDRPRIPGSLTLQGFRRTNQYSSSPPTQGDSGDYSRGSRGKWESRPSDRDSDSQSDRDSDSGRRFGHQSRGSWQNREQDGLLGSGSFQKPFGYGIGSSSSKMQSHEPYQPSKSTEPYHPPRPYKALPHARRDTDSYNDETFGSMECTSEDKAEEERKRRASFELMRKEQQKVLQEKQKLNLEKHKEVGASDLSDVLDDSKEEKELTMGNELEVTAGIPINRNDLEKSSFASHSPASRPLVPPGFQNNILDKKNGSKSFVDPPLSKALNPVTEACLLDAESNLAHNGMEDSIKQQLSQQNSLVDGKPAFEVQHYDLLNKEENVNLLTSLGVPILKHDMQDQLASTSSHSNSHRTLDDRGIQSNTDVFEGKIVGNFNGTDSTSTLEDFLGTALSVNDSGSTSTEHDDRKTDDSKSVQSSKFAQWFFQEETKAVDMLSEPTDRLSVIASGDKGRYRVSDVKAAENLPPIFSDKILEQLDHPKVDIHSTDDGISNQLSINKNKGAIPTVLTCEDLEQSILSEYSSKDTTMPSISTSWSSDVANTKQQNIPVDGHASIHLLSLLQKGTDKSINSAIDVSLADNVTGSQEHDVTTAINKPIWEEDGNSAPNSVNTLTLETLFGTAFMKELQSVEAPVSVQRVSTGSTPSDTPVPPGLPFPASGNEVSSLANNNIPHQRPSHDYGILSSDGNQQTNLSMVENWHALGDSQNDIASLLYRTEANSKNIGFPDLSEVQFPEDSSISSSDSRRNLMSRSISIGNSSNHRNSSFDGHIEVMDKLPVFRDVKNQQLVVDRENLPFTRGSYELGSQMPYRNSQRQQAPWQFQTPQMSQTKPLYHHLESHHGHTSSEMNFLGPEPIFRHESTALHPFRSTLNQPSFPLPNVRVAGFEVPPQRPVPLQQMQVSGNHPPFSLPEFSRGRQISHHSSHSPAFIQEMNQMQSSHFRPPMPNIGSRGAHFPGNTPEGFQRLIDMELRANSKQMHPLALARNQGFHGHETDMRFQYR